MLRHYFNIALRNLWRNRFHASINIIGLAIGISACLVIYLIVTFEMSYNTSIPDADRIYRLHSHFSGSFAGLNSGVSTAVGPYVQDHFKQVESSSMFFTLSEKVTIPGKSEEQKFDEQQDIVVVGPEYFNVLNMYQWRAGSPQLLTRPHHVVLTESKARKYFGDQSIDKWIGRRVIYRDSLEVTVVGILADATERTDFDFHDFISYPTIEATWLKDSFGPNDWQSTNSSTQLFLKMQRGAGAEQLKSQLGSLSKEYNDRSQWARNDFSIQRLSDLHFDAELGIFDTSRSPAHRATLYTLTGIAVLLLVIGAINFINLETAQSIRRSREVGVRKVLGSSRTRLVLQFVSESLVLTLISVALAVPLAEVGLMSFSEFVPAGVSINIANLLPFLVIILLVVGLLASLYPALVLSSFLPVLALKNHSGSQVGQAGFLRKSLIVFQFTFAQALIMGTLLIGWQIRYVLSKDLGFRKDAVIYIEAPWWENHDKVERLQQRLRQLPEISEMSLSAQPPAYRGWSSSSVSFKNGKEEVKVNAYRKFGDTSYLHFYGIQLLAGRNLNSSDTLREVLINETLLKRLGFNTPEAAIGQDISFAERKVPIVGVVHDFHFQSLHHVVEPVMLADEEKRFGCFNLRLTSAGQSGSQLKEILAKIEKEWKEVYPDAPFQHRFLDDTIKSFYETEQRTAKLAQTATILAIFISCLGLFGLASYESVQRTKEIGIRKVMGASAREIVVLLSRNFLILVLLGFLVAAPAAWYFAGQWLRDFAYHTNISVWLFVLTALLTMVVAFITVSYQTIRAARANPVESLRHE